MGKPREFGELVAVIVSLLRVRHEVEDIHLADFYRAMEAATRRHPEYLRGLDFERHSRFVASRTLDVAITHALPMGLELSSERLRVNPERATEIIRCGKKRTSRRCVREMGRVSQTMLEALPVSKAAAKAS